MSNNEDFVLEDEIGDTTTEKETRGKNKLKSMLRMTKSFAKSPLTTSGEDSGIYSSNSGVLSGDDSDVQTGTPTRKSSGVALVTYGSSSELETAEATARQKKEDSFLARVIKIRLTCSSQFLQMAFFKDLLAKRLLTIECYEPYARAGIIFTEERMRLVFEVYITLAKELDQSRRQILAGESLIIAHYNSWNTHMKERWMLEDDHMMGREEIEHEYYGWMQWYLVELSMLEKDAMYGIFLVDFDNQLGRMALDALDMIGRVNIINSEEVRRLLSLSNLILQCHHDTGVMGLLLADKALTQEFKSNIKPLLTIRKAMLGYHDRKKVFQLLVDDWPYRRKMAAVAKLHNVVKGFFIRKFFHVHHDHCHKAELNSVRLIQRCGRAYIQGRVWIVHYDLRQRLQRIEMYRVALQRVQSDEEVKRAPILEESDYLMEMYLSEARKKLEATAIEVLQRVTSAFVARYDLFLWHRYGRDPVKNAVGRGVKTMTALNRACDWHALAARHNLWDAEVCDGHL